MILSIFELIGTIAFAISGAIIGMGHRMDIFGVCILGITTACGGGMLRDIILGLTPPAMFLNPQYVLVATTSSLLFFLPAVRRLCGKNLKIYDTMMLITDAIGLGAFTVCGMRVAIQAGYYENMFLVIFVGVITGVGGGLLRDIFAGDRPYIFIKHIYACASILGGLLCYLLWEPLGAEVSMMVGCALVIVIRLCSAHFRWSLPH